ncbi:MAG: hypothetical protein M1816_000428 [Peltula sp. TS41687]|nr:MAG: hypothetical protein M1816_000428 [Peltula sp. TS41687]
MVSLWPWRGDDASPASFERALSVLSAKISKHSAHLDALRQRSRRLKGLWTLYAGFAYILYTVVLGLVVGWKNWGGKEYTAVAGGPVLIYMVRLVLRTYYDYRIKVVTDRLSEVQREREKTIEKLKAATRYNTTQQLLEKYGGAPSSSSPLSSSASPGSSQKRRPGRGQDSPLTPRGSAKRVSLVPPPTANIPRNNNNNYYYNDALVTLPSTPPQPHPNASSSPLRPRLSASETVQPGPPEFAPNAFSGPQPQYVVAAHRDAASRQSHWYDRLLDVLLGEDETLPKNRLALICSHCKLVNGQAPPGVKRLEEVGRWRCVGCAGWNGEEVEARRLVDDIKQQTRTEATGVGRGRGVRGKVEEENERHSEMEGSENGLDSDGEFEGEEELEPVYRDDEVVKTEEEEEEE